MNSSFCRALYPTYEYGLVLPRDCFAHLLRGALSICTCCFDSSEHSIFSSLGLRSYLAYKTTYSLLQPHSIVYVLHYCTVYCTLSVASFILFHRFHRSLLCFCVFQFMFMFHRAELSLCSAPVL